MAKNRFVAEVTFTAANYSRKKGLECLDWVENVPLQVDATQFNTI